MRSDDAIWSPRTKRTLICIALAAGTFALYAPIVDDGFINYDDPQYVTHNDHVKQGLTWETFRWSWTSQVHGNWHPLTMLSHALDVTLYGVAQPSGHHLTSLLLHIACTVVLFLVLDSATGAVWASAVVAALFAWHPTRVESVAWIAERKDVLSTLFWFLALGAYVAYARSRSWWRYALVALLLACGLMSKAMLVTFPCLVLLWDVWPLRRLSRGVEAPRAVWRRAGLFVVEKLPLFALVAISAVITFQVQKTGGFVKSLDGLSLGERVITALDAYGSYIAAMLWPTRLALMYPLPSDIHISAWTIGSSIVLVACSLVALLLVRRRPYVFVGWFWYVGTLVPVIGLVQVGTQSMADRYTYVPLVGLFLIVAFGARDFLQGVAPARQAAARAIVAAASVAVFSAMIALTVRQVGFWRDELTLFSRPFAVTTDNYIAHYNYGNALSTRNRFLEAIEQYELALALKPNIGDIHFNLGKTLVRYGRLQEALPHLEKAIRHGNHSADALFALGYCEELLGMLPEAEKHYLLALDRDGNHRRSWLGLGDVLRRQNKTATAIKVYQRMAQPPRTSRTAIVRLAWIYATHPEETFRNPQYALELTRGLQGSQRRVDELTLEIYDALGAAYAAVGDFNEAVEAGQSAYVQARGRWDNERKAGMTEAAQRTKQLMDALARRIRLYENEQEFREDPTEALY